MDAPLEPPRLCLASASARRRMLLSLLVADFEIRPAAIDESPLPGEGADALCLRLADLKAASVFSTMGRNFRVLGGDTVVATEEQRILGKPADSDQARQMLEWLSGRSHRVYSAVAICDNTGLRHRLSTSVVTFRELSATTIARYCASNDPYDKAGGYGIQGEAGDFVTRLDGSYSGVMGLPLWHTHQLLFGGVA